MELTVFYYPAHDLQTSEIIGYCLPMLPEIGFVPISNIWTNCYSCSGWGIFSLSDTVVEFRRIEGTDMVTFLIKFEDGLVFDGLPTNGFCSKEQFWLLQQRVKLVLEGTFLHRPPKSYLELQVLALPGFVLY